MQKPEIVIMTNSTDAHASCVELVLKKMSKRVMKFNTASYARGGRCSIRFADDRLVVDLDGNRDVFSDVSSSWNRRFSKLFSLPNNLHPADYDFARNNLSSVLNGIVIDLDRRFAVNTLASSRLISNKLSQLRLASLVGIKVPETLVSNDLNEVRSFVNFHGAVCMKPYHTHGWITPSGPVQALATKIFDISESDKAAVSVFPHFYQKFVDKKFEYRVTIFGNYAESIRFATHDLPGNSSTDWRSSPHYLGNIEKSAVPDYLVHKLKQLMKLLGIRFGTFDLAETYSGDFVFFEVNESGQWIWSELYCPECVLLQPFTEFLSQAREDFSWSKGLYSEDLSAASICRELSLSPEFDGTMQDEFPDESVHASDEVKILNSMTKAASLGGGGMS